MYFFWSERRFLLWATLSGLLVSLLVAFVLPPSYESVARLLNPLPTHSNALLIGLLRSRSLEDNLIARFGLREIYWDRTWDEARKDLEKHTDFGDEESYGILTIRVRDHSANRATGMAQAFVEELNALLLRQARGSAHQDRTFLDSELSEARLNLDSSEERLRKYSSENLFVDMEPQEQGMLILPAAVQEKLTADQRDNDAAEGVYGEDVEQDAMSARIGDRLNFSMKAANDIKTHLISEQTELKGLKTIFADGNLQVRSSEARIDQFQSALAKLMGSSNGKAPSGSDRASIYPSLSALPWLGTDYADLYRNVGLDEMFLGVLTEQDERAKLAELRDTPSISVLDPPSIPEKSSWPPRFWIIAVGGICSLIASAAWKWIGATR